MLCEGETFLALFWSVLPSEDEPVPLLQGCKWSVRAAVRVMSLTNLLVRERWFLNKVNHVKEVLETD